MIIFIKFLFPWNTIYLIMFMCKRVFKQQLASVSPRHRTSSSQPRFTAWLCLGISKPSISSSHLRLLCNTGRVALGNTLVGADLGLHHLENPRACAPSGQLQTMSEYHHTTTSASHTLKKQTQHTPEPY